MAEESVEELKKKIAYLEELLGLLPGNLYWKNKDGLYQGCNDTMAQRLGLQSRDDIVGKSVYDLLTYGDAKRIEEADNDIMAKGEEFEFEEILTTADKLYSFLSKKAPIKDENDEVFGMVGVSFDITERKDAEALLIQAKERAESANRAKTDFIMNMKHDLRTPCAGIIGLTEILVKEEDRPEKREELSYILESGKRLLDLLNQIIDVAKVQEGSLGKTEQIFSLKELIGDVVGLLQAEIRFKELYLNTHYREGLPETIKTDKVRLQRIILNLVSNAIKFTPEGGVDIFIDFDDLDANQDNLRVTVKDTGVGIPKEKFGYIFERFTRIDNSHHAETSGTGSGLYIVEKFVEDLNGHVEVDSAINYGSRFTCVIPVQIFQQDGLTNGVGSSSVQKKMPQDKANRFHQANVLFVEDDKIARHMGKIIFEKLGADVSFVEDGEQALEAVQLKKYDAIFMDIGLPGIDGIETIKRIQQGDSFNKNTPVIMMTAHSEEKIDPNIPVLVKPLTIESITTSTWDDGRTTIR